MLMLTANPMGPARGPHLFPSSKVRSRKGAIKMTTTAVVPIHAGLSKKIFSHFRFFFNNLGILFTPMARSSPATILNIASSIVSALNLAAYFIWFFPRIVSLPESI